MKKALLFLISLLVGVGLFIWIGKVVGWQKIWESLLVFTGWQGMLIFGLTILVALVSIWRWREVLKGMDVKIPFRELWRAYLVSFSIRYLAPIIIIGSEIFQGYILYILKEINSVPWSKSMASVIIDRILELTANLVVIFFGIFFFFFTIGLPPMKLAIIFGITFFYHGLNYLFYFKSFRRESLTKFFAKIFNNQLDTQPLEIEREIFNFLKLRKKRCGGYSLYLC